MSDTLSSSNLEQVTLKPQHVHTVYTVFKRVINVVLMIGFALLLGFWLYTTNQFYQTWFNTQSNSTSNAVIAHYSRLLTTAAVAQDKAKITSIIETLRQDEHVVQASVYGLDASPIAQTSNYQSMLSRLKDKQYPSLSAHVGEITHDEQVVGFLRVIVDDQTQQQQQRQFSETLTRQLLLLCVLGGVLGGYVVKGFYSLRRRIVRK